MYACILEIGRGFFEGVRGREHKPLTFRDPPPPHPATSSRSRRSQEDGALRRHYTTPPTRSSLSRASLVLTSSAASGYPRRLRGLKSAAITTMETTMASWR